MGKCRCAIYTRKSTEEGLDQAFNSLDAQREACEAYIKSQRSEGWTPIATAYDDGGFSGGNTERPALRRLLADIAAGKIDVVVVYKVDRLTRSLTDFAKIVDQFDARGVSFVSVTQAFNTTTSMGRLTLNVLLSFAQFEREVTGERIRDKIAASKAKGMWMGGNLPLGYNRPTDLETRALVVNTAEAETVAWIFERYLQLRSVHRLRDELDRRGIVSKRQTSPSGKVRGGTAMGRGALFHLLRNRVYVGDITHRGKAHPGRHQAIISAETFASVQTALDEAATTSGVKSSSGASLKGMIFDATGEVMSPTSTKGGTGLKRRYYVSTSLMKGKTAALDGVVRRVPGEDVDRLVDEKVQRLAQLRLVKVEVRDQAIHLLLAFDTKQHPYLTFDDAVRNAREAAEVGDRLIVEDEQLRLIVPTRFQRRGGRTVLLTPSGQAAVGRTATPKLAKALRQGHKILGRSGLNLRGDQGCEIAAPADSYERQLAEVAFLAPDIQLAILKGETPPGLTLDAIKRGAPLAWADQRRAFGF